MAVRTVHIQLNWPVGIDPAYQAARGKVYVGPHDRQLIDTSEILLPKPVTVKLDADGEATIDVLTGIVYKWDEDDVVGGDVRYFAVPEGLGAFEYASGEDLDPETLEPSTVAVGWWTADLTAEREARELDIAEVRDEITAAVDQLKGDAPELYNTLGEIHAALVEDDSVVAGIISVVSANTGAIAAHEADTANPHGVTKAQVGLGSVDNTPDADKPVSTAQAEADAAVLTAATAAPLVTKRTLGDIALANTGSGFADLDDTGTPNARNLDIVFPNVEAGQVVELELNLLASNGAGVGFLTFASIVAGSPVNRIHGANTGGVAGWFLPASEFGKATGAVPYTLQAGDIEDGNARFRPQYKSAGTKTIYANSTSTYTLTVVGRGPKG